MRHNERRGGGYEAYEAFRIDLSVNGIEIHNYLMRNSHFSVCNLQGYATWNLAVLDSVANYCCPVVRRSDLMNNLFPLIHNIDWAQQCTFHNFKDLLTIMRSALDKPINDLRYDLMPKPATQISDEHIEKTILSLISQRLDSKVPKKYDSVKSFITNRTDFPDKVTKFGVELMMNNSGVVTKKDWINYFWSFHANGNFQKIRWRLLSEGIKDDITQRDTTYSV